MAIPEPHQEYPRGYLASGTFHLHLVRLTMFLRISKWIGWDMSSVLIMVVVVDLRGNAC